MSTIRKPLAVAVLTVIIIQVVLLLSGYVNFEWQQQAGHPYFVITFPSAHRPGDVNYIADSFSSLACALSNSSSWPMVVAINTEVPPDGHPAFNRLADSVNMTSFLKHGIQLVNVTKLHPELHSPKFVKLLAARAAQTQQEAHGLPDVLRDPADRLWWRSKEALDAAYALEKALQAVPSARYVLFFQDDIAFAPGFAAQLQEFIEQKVQAKLAVDIVGLYSGDKGSVPEQRPLDAPLMFGAVAFAIKADVAWRLASYIRTHFWKAPVDWMLADFTKHGRYAQWVYYPNLVQHMGLRSTLKGKQQPLRSATFVDNTCLPGAQ